MSHRKVLRHLYLWAGCLIVSLCLLCSFYVYQKYVILNKNRPFASLKDTNTHLGATLEEIRRIKEELERLQKEESALESIDVGPQSYAKILAKLSGIMNENTWLTGLAVDQVKDEEHLYTLKLDGFSLSNEGVGDFLNKLSSEPMFMSAKLKYARETKMGRWSRDADKSVKLINFQVECHLSKG